MGSIVAEIADKLASDSTGIEIRGGVGAEGGGILTLSTSELTVVDGDKLGRIDFQAPLETGADALLVTASIWAEADETFAATANATELVFAVGDSTAAAEVMRIDHDGQLGIGVATPASLLHVAGTVQVGVDDTGHDVIFYGDAAGALAMWDASADALLVRGATADHATDSAGRIVLQTNQAAVADNDIIGRLDFQASNETGADALLVSASIYAEAEETFDATTNGTALVFAVGDGAAAAEVARFDHDGQFGIGVAPNAQLTVEGTIKLKEQSAAVADTAAYGQLWVDDAANSPLYFTNDAGADIGITTGSTLNAASLGGVFPAIINTNGSYWRHFYYESAGSSAMDINSFWDNYVIGPTSIIDAEDERSIAIYLNLKNRWTGTYYQSGSVLVYNNGGTAALHVAELNGSTTMSAVTLATSGSNLVLRFQNKNYDNVLAPLAGSIFQLTNVDFTAA
jgi:hypothetical protein